jgi:hypothetical protein
MPAIRPTCEFSHSLRPLVHNPCGPAIQFLHLCRDIRDTRDMAGQNHFADFQCDATSATSRDSALPKP